MSALCVSSDGARSAGRRTFDIRRHIHDCIYSCDYVNDIALRYWLHASLLCVHTMVIRSSLQLERPVFEPGGGEPSRAARTRAANDAAAADPSAPSAFCPSPPFVSPSASLRALSKASPAARAASRGVISSTSRAVSATALVHSDDPGTCPAKICTERAAPRAWPYASPAVAPSLNPTLNPAWTVAFLPSSTPSRYPSFQNCVGCRRGNRGQREVGKTRPRVSAVGAVGREKRDCTRPRVPARVFVEPRVRARKYPRRRTRPGLRETRARRSRPPKGRPPWCRAVKSAAPKSRHAVA